MSDAAEDADALTITAGEDGNLGAHRREIGLDVNFKLSEAPDGLQVPSLQVPAAEIEISGSPDYVSDVLSLLQVSVAQAANGLVNVNVTDGVASVDFTPVYVPVLNAVPDAGGNVTATNAIDEEGGPQDVRVWGIYKNDSDAYDTVNEEFDAGH